MLWQSKRLLQPCRQHHVILDLRSVSIGTRLWARLPASDSQRADLLFSRHERFQASELSLASSFLFPCLFFPSLFLPGLRMVLEAYGPAKSWRVICTSKKPSSAQVGGSRESVGGLGRFASSLPGLAPSSVQGRKQELHQLLSLPRASDRINQHESM